MAYKTYKQTRFNIALSLLGEKGKKFGSFAKFTVRWFVLFLVVSLMLGLCFAERGGSIFDVLGSGSWMLINVFPEPNDAPIPCWALWASRAFGLILSALFAGISVAIFMEPVNPIAFSRYVAIDLEQQRLRFRYWIRKPEKRYLYDAMTELVVTGDGEDQNGSTLTNYAYRYREPENTPSIPLDCYAAIRGVRYCDIPFDQPDLCNPDRTLRDVLIQLCVMDNVQILFRVVGAGEDGRVVYRDRRYSLCDLMCGYNFLSIRQDEIRETAERQRKAKGGVPSKLALCATLDERKKDLFHEHFNVMYRQKFDFNNPFADCNEIAGNKPDSLYLVDPIDCVKEGFRLRETQLLIREWAQKMQRKIHFRKR